MSAPMAHLLAGLLLDVGAKATIVLAAGFAGDALLARRSAAERHALWAATLLSLPALAPAVAAARGQDLAVEAAWLGGVWAVGALVALTPLVVGRWWLGAVARRGQAEGEVVRARPGDVSGPLMFGWLRPRVVVPADWETWAPAHREAALAHERAHVARQDWAMHAAGHVVCALFWFHPLVWAARRRLVMAAELAADDAALATGLRASDYASALLYLSRLRAARAGLSASQGAERRIRAVLELRPRGSRRGPALVVAAAAQLPTLVAISGFALWAPPATPPGCAPDGASFTEGPLP